MPTVRHGSSAASSTATLWVGLWCSFTDRFSAGGNKIVEASVSVRIAGETAPIVRHRHAVVRAALAR